MSFSFKLEGGEAFLEKLGKMPEAVTQELTLKINRLLVDLHRRTKIKLTNRVLHVRTGALRDSIQIDWAKQKEHRIEGRVYSAGVKYAAIHEFGGTTRPHDIPNAFGMGFTVRHPGSVIPKRSYLHSTMKEMQNQIKDGLIDAVKKGMKKS